MPVVAGFTCRLTMPEDEPQDPGSHPLGDLPEPDREYDQELGRKLGDAARKVQAGEMTEAEFHDRFHEDLLAEVGVDDRPLDISEK